VVVEDAIDRPRSGVALARDRKKSYLLLDGRYEVAGVMSTAERVFARALQIRPDAVEASREIRLLSARRDKSKGFSSDCCAGGSRQRRP
jgi:hypothetical protein